MARQMLTTYGGNVHEEDSLCGRLGCTPASEVPEFTVETRYVAENPLSSRESGWKFALRWRKGNDPKNPEQFEHDFGYNSRLEAVKEAKERAAELARASLEPETFKFTPEL